jgi:regulator of G-protein signaling 3
MSFGIRHLTNPKKEVNGWYYLLTEDVGRKKHLQVSHRQHPQLRIRSKFGVVLFFLLILHISDVIVEDF